LLSNKNINAFVFDRILPPYFVILYNTSGMSHLMVMINFNIIIWRISCKWSLFLGLSS